jgi:four helix bundle protein
MIADQLRARTRQFALDVIVLCSRLGLGDLARVVRPQLLRAATGIAANYRAACRSRSLREFVSRLAVVVEECDEAELWLDVVETMALGDLQRASMLRKEAAELLAVMSSSRRTALQRLKQGHGK